jgi:hypothetical protein
MELRKTQLFWLVVLRVVIGWHFLYEGLVKLVNPNWSSLGYLLDSEGPLQDVFFRMASAPSLLQVVDFKYLGFDPDWFLPDRGFVRALCPYWRNCAAGFLLSVAPAFDWPVLWPAIGRKLPDRE